MVEGQRLTFSKCRLSGGDELGQAKLLRAALSPELSYSVSFCQRLRRSFASLVPEIWLKSPTIQCCAKLEKCQNWKLAQGFLSKVEIGKKRQNTLSNVSKLKFGQDARPSFTPSHHIQHLHRAHKKPKKGATIDALLLVFENW